MERMELLRDIKYDRDETQGAMDRHANSFGTQTQVGCSMWFFAIMN